MRAVMTKLLDIPLTRDADNEPKIPFVPGFHSRESIFDDNCSRRVNSEQLCRHQEGIWSGFPGQVLCVDRVAIDLHIEEVIQFDGL